MACVGVFAIFMILMMVIVWHTFLNFFGLAIVRADSQKSLLFLLLFRVDDDFMIWLNLTTLGLYLRMMILAPNIVEVYLIRIIVIVTHPKFSIATVIIVVKL